VLRFVTVTLAVACAAPAGGQQPDPVGRDSMYYRYLQWPSLVKNWQILPNWQADGSTFWYDVELGGDTVIYLVDPEANTRRVLEAPPEPDGGTVGRTRSLPGEALSPRGDMAVEIREHDVWLRFTATDSVVRLTRDGSKEHGWSVGAPGDYWFLSGGHGPQVAWSPDGSRIAVKKLNRAGVDSIPLVNWLGESVGVEWHPYARAGRSIAQEELWVLDVPSGRATRIDDRFERDVQLPLLGWSPDGGILYFMRATRDHKRRDVMAADVRSGDLRELLSETSSTWLSLASRSFHVLSDSRGFLWMSERDGWNQVYLYDVDGALRAQLTRGDFPVSEVLAIDEEDGWVYVMAHGDQARPYDRHLYRAGLDGSGLQRLTEATGRHTIQLAPSKRFFIDRHSTIDRPPVTELRRADGTFLRRLAEADTSGLADLDFLPGEEFVVEATDGDAELWGALYKPWDFDPTQSYPVVEFIGEGPIETDVQRTFIHNQIFQAWAQLGFIVFIVDGRGTAERGKRFRDVRYGSWGAYEIEEHVSVLRQLADTRPYMDLERVGIVGYSWGGYYSIRALLTAPEVYRVGVALAPDPELSEITWDAIEPYLPHPDDDPAAWERASNTALAGRLQGQLLMIQGTHDRIVPVHGTMLMADALIAAKKRFDMLVVPGLTHSLTDSPREVWRYVWGEAIPRYLQLHLQRHE
jgi:dipeptidyl aminopeptidase/acylaminoacyl peptidase